MKELLNMRKFQPIKFFAAIIVSFMAGIIGSIPTLNSVNTWYSTLNKPFFNPPNWVFAPVWNILYLLMGVAFYIILISKPKEKEAKDDAVKFFLLQLLLNAIWSIIFFGLRLPLVAFFEIVFLWFILSVTIRKFIRISSFAAVLLIPYFLWVTFAMMLNAAIVLLN